MKRIYLLGLFLGFCFSGFTQIITIQDADTGQPIEMATISSEALSVYATTDAGGQADISAFKGATSIEIRMLGYDTKTLSFEELKADKFSVVLFPGFVLEPGGGFGQPLEPGFRGGALPDHDPVRKRGRASKPANRRGPIGGLGRGFYPEKPAGRR